MRKPLIKALCITFVGAWAVAVAIGARNLLRYESTPGASAAALQVWPVATALHRTPNLPTLVLSIHPHCPCSRASLGELARLMVHCQGKLQTIVLMVRPVGVSATWNQTDLFASASSIPGVTVISDDQGIESQRFHALTSGQAFLYGATGELLFAGGITESRGHSGDNAGESAILAFVQSDPATPAPAHTPVYGCSLFDSAFMVPTTPEKAACAVCRP